MELHRILISICLTMSWTYAGEICAAERQARLSIEGVRTVRVEALAGDLIIEGRAKTNEILARGTPGGEGRLRLVAERNGSEGVIRVERPPEAATNTSDWLDLHVSLPNDLPLRVVDSSGDMEIRGVESVALLDSSGDIAIRQVAGKVTIEGDSSGNIEIEHVQGGVQVVEDSSGHIKIETVTGDVRVVNDSSGNIEIRGVTGGVEVGNDSSGDIEIERVGRSVRVGMDSSGDIRVSDVRGDFTVEADSSGGIRLREVKGRVRIPKRAGR